MITAAIEDRRDESPSQAAVPCFEALLPAVRNHAEYAFRLVHPARREDLISETIANAFCAYQRLVECGRGELAYAYPLARYAIRQVREGRRVGTKMNVRDVTSEYCQRNKGVTVSRLDRYDRREQRWQDILVEDRRNGPADIVAAKLDFTAWLQSLPRRLRQIAQYLAAGETTRAAARRFRLSPSRISQIRRELQGTWNAFQGEPTSDAAAA